MKAFEFYRNIRLSNKLDLKNAFDELNRIYNKIPETTGCLDNIKKKKGCGAWCCKIQTPQFLYSEFLLIWKFISRNWNDDDICDLFEKCMINVINEVPSKGCVLFDSSTKMCKIHDVRPYNCRIYGITPEEEFNPRYEKLKKEYKSMPAAVLKDQCDLVSTKNKEEITVDNTNQWWEEITSVEKSIGIDSDFITDKIGGSYRTPHDHILLYNMPENILNVLLNLQIGSNFTYKEKVVYIHDLVNNIRKYFKGVSIK